MDNQVTSIEGSNLDKPLPVWFLIILPFYAGGFLALLLLPASGDWRWLEAWLVIITFSLMTSVFYTIINYQNPRVLRNRMKIKREGLGGDSSETSLKDQIVMVVMGLAFFGFVIVAAISHRYDWSSIPFAIEMVGLALVNLGYGIMNTAILQNAFASKLLDINQDQQLIDTGLYGQVRHPLYAGAILWLLSMPIALGSWWALIPAVLTAAVMVYRIEPEERMLVEGMVGYEDYRKRVKYKLIPRIY
jgi:protein-S-isoprenylcysteine O-methyltransferase Ste14